MRWVVVAATLLAQTACVGKKVVVDGFELVEKTWTADQAQLTRIAAADLDCPADQIVLAVVVGAPKWPSSLPPYPVADQVKATGCDKAITYQRISQTDSFTASVGAGG